MTCKVLWLSSLLLGRFVLVVLRALKVLYPLGKTKSVLEMISNLLTVIHLYCYSKADSVCVGAGARVSVSGEV